MNLHVTFLRALIIVSLAGFSAQAVWAEPVLTWTPGITISRLSADGSVGTGNSTDGTYSPSRWTPTDGVVRLGQYSGEILGRSGGIPGISADGEKISSSIASFDSTVVTHGRWTKGLGWEQLMPPLPPGVVELDQSYGSAWGISGDGSTVVGYAWHSPGRAYCSAWNETTGMTLLGGQDPDYDSRANDADFDGNVIVGWSSIGFGYWQPTVWEDGALTVLHASERWCEAKAVNPAGDTIVGSALDTLTGINSAAMWVKNGPGWDEHILGALSGTFGNGVGNVFGLDLNADASIVVGANHKDNWTGVGFVWDLEQGIRPAVDWLADLGVALPDSYAIYAMHAISDDGSTLAGVAYNQFVYPPEYEGFVVTLDDVSSVPRADLSDLSMGPATPNPFNPVTSFALSVTRSSRIEIDVFDARGHLVRRLHNGIMAPGEHTVEWDGRMENGRHAPSGLYLARARDEWGHEQMRRMTMVK